MEPINVEERVQKARRLFSEGYNCAQSVLLAYADVFGMEPQLAAKISAPLGGGVGKMREVCGTVSGMAIIAGLMEPAADPSDKEAKMKNYALVQELAGAFRKVNGSIICRELLVKEDEKDVTTSSSDTSASIRKRPCAEYVATAARLVGEKLQERS
ncbi:C-GCAxxG-C-C family protein [Tannerella forsythia]|uniref:C_GCAxxG_C_C family protein n=1 Tax=Tannerella forsythia TaxID=28112 RepID=A0A3P1Z8X6_TANFO|nr:C-GCAxxG-C-C family protein [Tannerella forsythia]RRD79589.1 C_GCAxxG_C_C family protein [Tannerella forsythia]